MTGYLTSVIKQFEYYKMLAEKTFNQVPDEALNWKYNDESNSIVNIVHHLCGNMLSRWTDFLTTDGEKTWRNRDAEFEDAEWSRDELMKHWDEGWSVFLQALHDLKDDDLDRIIYIRNQGHTVMEAINRQLAHYPYHVGQIVYIGKMVAARWSSLSIPKGASQQFNTEKFAQPPHRAHFTDDALATPAPLDPDKAERFTKEWVKAFNSHDLDGILSHYADQIEFYSPFIIGLKFNEQGMIKGKEDLRKYFEIGLKTYPDLSFKLHGHFTGVNTVVIYYTSVKEMLASEVFTLNSEGKAIKVMCNYTQALGYGDN